MNSRTNAWPPFTNGEILQALTRFLPAEVVEEYRRDFGDALDEPSEAHVTDGVLLILSTLSEDLADRVTAYRPDLQERVREVRAEPEAFFRTLRPDAEPE